MPTNHRRIAVTEDPPLAAALASVAPFYPHVAPARLVHDLAIKGAQVVLDERRRTGDGIEALVALSTEGQPLIDWNALTRVDEAWGD